MSDLAKPLANFLKSGYCLVELVTWEEDRALAVIKRAAEALAWPVNVWSASEGFGDHPGPEGADPSQALTRINATADPRLFILLDFHPALQDPVVTRRLRDLSGRLAGRRQGIVLVLPSACAPLELEKDLTILDLPPPGRLELKAMLEGVMKEMGTQGPLLTDPKLQEAVIRAALGLTGREFIRLMKRLLLAHPDFGFDQVRLALEEKKNALRRAEMLEFHEVEHAMEHVGGLDLLKKWLQDRAEAFGDKARSYGLPEPKGLLLLGVQGCGKSLSAKAVSRQWGIPLLRLDLSANAERPDGGDHFRRSLTVAESLAPCVLWIDEIEKGFSVHRVSGTEASGHMARAFAHFLIWLQEKKSPVYVIATANSISELPPELVRKGRFDDIFFVDLPQLKERADIFGIHLKKRGRVPKLFDLETLAKAADGFSGAEIEQAVIAAMYEAFTANRELTDKDVLKAIQSTVPLSETLEEQIKQLRDWAKTRARPASLDTTLMDLLKAGDD